MINKILIAFLSIATLLFAPLSEASNMIKSNQHPTLREMSIFYDRINVSENWQQWIMNYLESSHDATDEIDEDDIIEPRDRKSTRLNSSHVAISYAVFCLKKKIK